MGLDNLVCFETTLPNSGTEFLLDHNVCGRSIMPGAGYATLILEAVREAKLGTVETAGGIALQDLQFHRPLELDARGVRVQTLLQRADGEASVMAGAGRGLGAFGRKMGAPCEWCARAFGLR